MKKTIICLLLSILFTNAYSQDSTKTVNTSLTSEEVKPEEKKIKWYDKMSIRGYTQIRYNRLFESNENFKSEQGDRSIGRLGGFFIRRMRIIFYGQLNEHVYFYIQPDFASSAASNSLHFGQLRDAYFDISVDKNKEFRFRIGQSKVPFGFENMQSSQNRLPMDRNDALNSAVSNERDLGVFFMYAPKKVRELYSTLVNDGFKGSGDYGIFSFGGYNGQTANKAENNENMHWCSRVTYPFQIGNQVIEPSLQMYSGVYTLYKDQLTTGVKTTKNSHYKDERYAATFVLYPKPFGIQAEYNVGVGPQYDLTKDSIMTKDLKGGYVTASYLIKFKKHVIIPFVRASTYTGGKKHELDARAYEVNEIEGGVEYQFTKNFELTATWLYSEKMTSDKVNKNNFQIGNMLRLQAQMNF